MILYIVRHAVAFDRDAARWPDDRDRPLTKKGEKRFKAVAAALKAMSLPVKRVLSSSLARAWQTARLLEKDAEWPAPQKCESLEPGHDPGEVVAALTKYRDDVIVLVGHEPGLSKLIGYMVANNANGPIVEMKKGGVACIEFNGTPVAGRGKLLWLAPPKLLLRDLES
jgi:phosphohistidine phosphatase